MQIFELLELKLMSFTNDYGLGNDWMLRLKLSNLLVYKKFLEKVLRKNPNKAAAVDV